jgi:hypothetical protein
MHSCPTWTILKRKKKRKFLPSLPATRKSETTRFNSHRDPCGGQSTTGILQWVSRANWQALSKILRCRVSLVCHKINEELGQPGAAVVCGFDNPSFPISFFKCANNAMSIMNAMRVRRKDSVSAIINGNIVLRLGIESTRVIKRAPAARNPGHECKKVGRLDKGRTHQLDEQQALESKTQ